MNKLFATIMATLALSAYAADTVIQTDTLVLGKPAAGAKTIKLRQSTSATQPALRYNNSTSQIEQSDAGTTFVRAGSLQGSATALGASALFQADSTTLGFLGFPRMTTTQKNAVSSPATGLLLYDSTLQRPAVYDATIWQSIAFLSDASSLPYRSVTTTDAPTTADGTLKLSGASFTITLYTAVGNSGKVLTLVHAGTSLTQVYTIATTSSQTVGGIASGSYVLRTNGETLRIASDGANWIILEHKTASDWIDGGVIGLTSSGGGVAKGTTDADKMRWRREGKDIILNYAYRQTGTGTAGTGDYLFGFPTNITADTTLITLYATVLGNGTQWKPTNFIGACGISGNTEFGTGFSSMYDSTHMRIFALGTASQSVACAASNWNTSLANVSYDCEVRFPVSGWQP